MNKPSLSITSNEIADYLHKASKKIMEDPLSNIDVLSDVGIVLTSIGIIRDFPSLKLLGDLFMDLPDKLRSLLSLKYSLVGTLGDIQSMVSKIVDESLTVITKVLNELEDMFRRNEVASDLLLGALGSIYELATVKLPSISTVTTVEEEE
ncbi:MAG: hypothetical protein ABWW69_06875 [Pyrodictiaceae archaeon]